MIELPKKKNDALFTDKLRLKLLITILCLTLGFWLLSLEIK